MHRVGFIYEIIQGCTAKKHKIRQNILFQVAYKQIDKPSGAATYIRSTNVDTIINTEESFPFPFVAFFFCAAVFCLRGSKCEKKIFYRQTMAS